MKAIIKKLAAKRHELRFWQYITLVQTLIFSSVISYGKIFPPQQPDVLVVDEGGYYKGKLEDFHQATTLHEEQTEIAALCLFQRSPKKLDYEDRLKQLFATDAYSKAQEMISADMAEFRTKSLHQKVEIREVITLPVRGKGVLSSLKGQLLRTGMFEGKVFSETLKLELNLQFVRNPNMAMNGAYPSIVTDFDVITTPTANR